MRVSATAEGDDLDVTRLQETRRRETDGVGKEGEQSTPPVRTRTYTILSIIVQHFKEIRLGINDIGGRR